MEFLQEVQRAVQHKSVIVLGIPTAYSASTNGQLALHHQKRERESTALDTFFYKISRLENYVALFPHHELGILSTGSPGHVFQHLHLPFL